MARYIDADILMDKIRKCEWELTQCGIVYHAGDVQSIIRTMRPADVAPRAEVEKIFEEIDKIVIRKVTHDGKIVYDVTDKYNELKKKYLGENKDGKI